MIEPRAVADIDDGGVVGLVDLDAFGGDEAFH